MSPKLSIIIPIYNTEEYLPTSLDSVLSQSFTDYELLLIDDGSTDGSGAICDAYAQRDPRIRVFHIANSGISGARNLGIDNATGEWLYFVDSDDELIAGGLQTLVDCISDDVDCVMGGFEEYNIDGELIMTCKDPTTRVLSKRDSLLTLYSSHSIHFDYLGYVWIRLFRSKVIQERSVRYDPTVIIKEDALFDAQYLCQSNGRTRFTTTPVYRYKLRAKSAMTTMFEKYNPKYLSTFDAVVKMHSAIHQLPQVDKLLSKAAKYEVIRRVYLIKSHMMDFNVLDTKCISAMMRRARKEVGWAYYMEYQYHRNVRRAKKRLAKLFKAA